MQATDHLTTQASQATELATQREQNTSARRHHGTPCTDPSSHRSRTEADEVQQTHRVFLNGCHLPAAWAGQTQWRVLDTCFSQGLKFLLTWAAWQADPQRPPQLHFTALSASAVNAEDVLYATRFHPKLQSLAEQLAGGCYGLLPGVHRLSFESGHVQLTLWIGDAQTMLRQQTTVADSIYLNDVSEGCPPCLWDSHSLKALTRHCRRGTQLAGLVTAGAAAAQLLQCGFEISPSTDDVLAPHALAATFNPAWEPRIRALTSPPPVAKAGNALVVGAGLAGSAAAHSLALRGWHVTVLGAGEAPADGASGLPAGLFCPHVSPDDSVLSRLSRNGVRQTLQRLQNLCCEGLDWGHSGVLEHCTDGGTGLPPSWKGGPGDDWSHAASAEQLDQAGLPPGTAACWHAQAGWVRPAQLVQAQLQHPNIRFAANAVVAQLQRIDAQWLALDAQGSALAQADLAVLACGPGCADLLPPQVNWPLQPIRGQITLGPHTPDNAAALPPFPVNGNGNLVTHISLSQGEVWVMGSTFERDVTELPISAKDQATAHVVNHDKLGTLLPRSKAPMAPWFNPQDARSQPTWGRLRVASYDRLPIVGPVDQACPNLWTLTALGARGLTLSVLCGELLAARLHGEPLPLDAKLAQHLSTERLARRN